MVLAFVVINVNCNERRILSFVDFESGVSVLERMSIVVLVYIINRDAAMRGYSSSKASYDGFG